jgi:hypothetical protein
VVCGVGVSPTPSVFYDANFLSAGAAVFGILAMPFCSCALPSCLSIKFLLFSMEMRVAPVLSNSLFFVFSYFLSLPIIFVVKECQAKICAPVLDPLVSRVATKMWALET